MKRMLSIIITLLLVVLIINGCDIGGNSVGNDGNCESISSYTVSAVVMITGYPIHSSSVTRTVGRIDRVECFDKDGQKISEEFQIFVKKDTSDTNLELYLSTVNVTTFSTSEVEVTLESNEVYQLKLGHRQNNGVVYEYVLISTLEEALNEIKVYLDIE